MKNFNVVVFILYFLCKSENIVGLSDSSPFIQNSSDQSSSHRIKGRYFHENYASRAEEQEERCQLIRDQNAFSHILITYMYEETKSLTCDIIEGDRIKSLSLKSSVNVFPSLGAYYLPDLSSNLSSQCHDDVAAIKDAYEDPVTLFANNFWALKLVDSWGKFQDGVLQGNTYFLGFFEECLAIEFGGSSSSRGRYCLMIYGSSSSEDVRTATSTIPGTAFPIAKFYGTCIPSSCTREELMKSVNEAMTEDGLTLSDVQCQSSVDDVTFNSAEIFGIVFFSLLIFILLLASIIDVFSPYLQNKFKKKGMIFPLASAFSIPKNMGIIFKLNTETTNRQIGCLHGIRFLSITWVILCHQFSFTAFTSSNNAVFEMSKNFIAQVVSNGDKSVDTFLTMSGLLLSYQFFTYSYTSGKFPLVKFYVHRLLRLTPPIALCVAFFATLAGFAVKGPFAHMYVDTSVESCQQFWWLDWTYFSNFVYRFGSDLMVKTGESYNCVSQCWYTAVDMQIYIIMPLVFLPFIKFSNKSIGFLLLGVWTFLSFLIPAVIIGVLHTYPSTLMSFDFEESTVYSYQVYLMPYCRASPYFVGIWAGYILWRNDQQKIVLQPYQVAIGWTVATIVGLYIMFGLYPWNQFDLSIPAADMKNWFSILYGGLQRGFWGACVSWVIISCHTGYGGMVNSFLSHAGIQPLSRLSYGIFLVSVPIQVLLIFSTFRSPYYNGSNKVTETCGVIFYSGIGALLLSLASELPVRNMERLIWQKPSKKPLEQN